MALELARAWIRVRADGSKLQGDFSQARSVAINQSRQINNIIRQNISIRQQSLGGTLAKWLALGGAAAGIVKLTKHMFTLASSIEKTRTALEVMIGSKAKTAALLKDLREMSLKVPISFQELVENARTLMGYGVKTKDLVNSVKTLGTIAAATGADFGRLALAYGQVLSKGRLQAPETRQFTEATVPLIQLLAIEYKKTSSEILQMQEDGKITFSMVKKALDGLVSGGGRYAGMLEKMAKTTEGAWQLLKNRIDFVLTEIGEAALPVLKELIEVTTEWADKAREAFGSVRAAFAQMMKKVADFIGVILRNPGAVWKIFTASLGVAVSFVQNNFQVLFLETIPAFAKAGALAIFEAFSGVFKAIVRLFSTDFMQVQAKMMSVKGRSDIRTRAEVYTENEINRRKAAGLPWRNQGIWEDSMERAKREYRAKYAAELAQDADQDVAPLLKATLENIKGILKEGFKEGTKNIVPPSDESTKNLNDALYYFKGLLLKAGVMRTFEEWRDFFSGGNRQEIDPDVGRPPGKEENKKRARHMDQMVGIAELGQKIQEQIFDKERELLEKIADAQEEGNAIASRGVDELIKQTAAIEKFNPGLA